MGRLSPLYLTGAALVGLSGCLLFTDPINEAPKVTITGKDTVVRGQTEKYWIATLEDEDYVTTVEWAEIDAQNEGCSGIAGKDWAGVSTTQRNRGASYDYKPITAGVTCICARATDSQGAVGYAPCLRVLSQNKAPDAIITDAEKHRSGDTRALCSSIHLSAAESIFPLDPAYDTVSFEWALVYSGTDANGENVKGVPCSGITKDPDQHFCFYAAVPGPYTVTLTITDTPSPAIGGDPLTSAPVSFVVNVDVDRPPCLELTEPDVHIERVLLSRSSDLGSSYESRTFKVLSAPDDCEPYPVPAESGKKPAQFVWSILDPAKSKTDWDYKDNSSSSFTISQSMFPNALPGDSIKLRVEVRDTEVQKIYSAGIPACSSPDTGICCDGGPCTGTNDCVRWTTWTVQFLP